MPRIILLFIAFVFLPSCQQTKDRVLTVTSIDVGQGDATLVTFPNGKVWLIDAGGNPAGDTEAGIDPGHRNVLPVLRAKAIQALDCVVMTHPDEDHIQGMLAVARHIPVRAVYWNGFQGSRVEQQVRQVFQMQGSRVSSLCSGNQTNVGNASVQVLGPPSTPILGTRSPENENSIVLLIRFGDKSVLLTGDIESAGERKLLTSARDDLKNISLLKVAHHGSESSSTPEFVRWAHPQTAFISCGKRNRYGHPSLEVLQRFARAGMQVYRTDECGMLEWTTDGENEWVFTFLPCNANALR